jgi:hypothetical protein
MSQLQQLLLSTPILTNLNVQLISDITPLDNTFFPTTEIRQLKMELVQKSNIEYDHLKILFEWMPKLNKLAFIAAKGTNFIGGDKWEYLIRNYLPQLKEFQFRIHLNLSTYSYINYSFCELPMGSSGIE